MAQAYVVLRRALWLMVFIGGILLVQPGCSGISTSEENGYVVESSFASAVGSVPNVSGMWEYQEGQVVHDLLLDRHGNGTYDWQQGRFETAILTQAKWKGTWAQSGNDREGGFEAWFAEDGMSASGKWWYTRIGNDTDPIKPGGEFILKRKGKLQGAPVEDIVNP